MKKLMCAIAAVSAGICMADVQSANIVGYTTTQTMKAGMWYIIGSNFEDVGGGSVRICDFLKNADLTAGSMTSDSATIQLRVNGVPVDYFYNQWYWDLDEGGFVPSWTTTMSVLATDTLPAGTGFWFKEPNNDITYTFSGQVVSEVSRKKEISEMWSLVANPFPTPLDLNENMDSSNLIAGSMTSDSATIQLRVNGVPVDYFYNQWYWDMNAGGFVPSWTTTMSQKPTAEERIAPGVGFWMKNPSATPVEVEFFLEKKPTAE